MRSGVILLVIFVVVRVCVVDSVGGAAAGGDADCSSSFATSFALVSSNDVDSFKQVYDLTLLLLRAAAAVR
jgi:hypothetical protein